MALHGYPQISVNLQDMDFLFCGVVVTKTHCTQGFLNELFFGSLVGGHEKEGSRV